MTRTASKQDLVRRLGARPVVADALDPDAVAYVTRKAILEPDNDSIHRAYAHIRETLRTERDGQALRLVRYAGGEESVEEARYRLVL